jgi:hypothetical protein
MAGAGMGADSGLPTGKTDIATLPMIIGA